mmetsp:Transcript_36088/g.82887  ORF Transcript_36088/g.82887 Transcript_36088/m.82887 type:complete len:217 (+) Transcript_36088:193-843(+)
MVPFLGCDDVSACLLQALAELCKLCLLVFLLEDPTESRRCRKPSQHGGSVVTLLNSLLGLLQILHLRLQLSNLVLQSCGGSKSLMHGVRIIQFTFNCSQKNVIMHGWCVLQDAMLLPECSEQFHARLFDCTSICIHARFVTAKTRQLFLRPCYECVGLVHCLRHIRQGHVQLAKLDYLGVQKHDAICDVIAFVQTLCWQCQCVTECCLIVLPHVTN